MVGPEFNENIDPYGWNIRPSIGNRHEEARVTGWAEPTPTDPQGFLLAPRAFECTGWIQVAGACNL